MSDLAPSDGSTLRAAARRIGAGLCAAFLVVLLFAAWRMTAGFVWIRALMTIIVAVCALRPRDALLMIAGLSLSIGVLGAAWQAPFSLRELVVLSALAGWFIRIAAARHIGRLLPADLSGPVICFSVVLVTSLIVELWGQRELIGPAELKATVAQSFGYGFLIDRRLIRGLNGTAWFLEGIALFAAVVAAAAGNRRWSLRVAAMAVIGATAGGMLNVLRIITVAIASGTPSERLRELASTVRVNVTFADVNAAGSYFAMQFFPAAAFAVASRAWWRRLCWVSCTAIVFVAAWLTKSRASIVAILIVSAALLVVRQRRGLRRAPLRIMFGVAACITVGFFLLATFPNPVVGEKLREGIDIRIGLTKISLQMLARQPVFGVGIDGYYDSSAPLLAASPTGKYYARENAHNNYLQLLAELGVVGFSVFVWLLWRVARRISSARGAHSDATTYGLLAGLFAFALTALTGHPLLTPEVNQAFWLMLGATAGAYPDVPLTGTSGRRRLTVAAFLVLMVAALPWRFRSEVATLNLEHVRYGVSNWMTDTDGARYQTFDDGATLFAPSSVSSMRIPIREPRATGESRLRIYLEGRLVNEIETAAEWRYVRIVTTPGLPHRNFLRIDLLPVPANGAPRELQVGRLDFTPPLVPR